MVSEQLIRRNVYELGMDRNNNNHGKYNLIMRGHSPTEYSNPHVSLFYDTFRKYKSVHFNIMDIIYSNKANRGIVGIGGRN